MNPSDSSTNFITRRDFMKKSALTVGAITLLSQGIGLAAGSDSGSDSGTPISWLWYKEKSTASDVTCSGLGDDMGEGAAAAAANLWYEIPGEAIEVYSFGPCEAYNEIVIDHQGFNMGPAGEGVWDCTWVGPVVARWYDNRPI